MTSQSFDSPLLSCNHCCSLCPLPYDKRGYLPSLRIWHFLPPILCVFPVFLWRTAICKGGVGSMEIARICTGMAQSPRKRKKKPRQVSGNVFPSQWDLTVPWMALKEGLIYKELFGQRCWSECVIYKVLSVIPNIQTNKQLCLFVFSNFYFFFHATLTTRRTHFFSLVSL